MTRILIDSNVCLSGSASDICLSCEHVVSKGIKENRTFIAFQLSFA